MVYYGLTLKNNTYYTIPNIKNLHIKRIATILVATQIILIVIFFNHSI